jgi:hypothetical protein
MPSIVKLRLFLSGNIQGDLADITDLRQAHVQLSSLCGGRLYGVGKARQQNARNVIKNNNEERGSSE